MDLKTKPRRDLASLRVWLHHKSYITVLDTENKWDSGRRG